MGDQVGTAESLESMAALAAAKAQPELAGAAAALRDAIGAPVSPMRRAILDRWSILPCPVLDGDIIDPSWAAGRATPLDQAFTLALATPNESPTWSVWPDSAAAR